MSDQPVASRRTARPFWARMMWPVLAVLATLLLVASLFSGITGLVLSFSTLDPAVLICSLGVAVGLALVASGFGSRRAVSVLIGIMLAMAAGLAGAALDPYSSVTAGYLVLTLTAGIIGLAFALAHVAVKIGGDESWRRDRLYRGFCPSCDYAIHGITSRRCPECGGSLELQSSARVEPSDSSDVR